MSLTAEEICEQYAVAPQTLLRWAKTVERGVTSLADIEGDVATRVEALALHKSGLGDKAAARKTAAAVNKAAKEATKSAAAKPAAKPVAAATKSTPTGKGDNTMARRGRSEVGGSDMYDFKKDGRILFGEYLGEREIGTRWKTDANPEGLKPVHKVKTPEGKTIEFWGTGILSNRLGSISEGDLIEIQFCGRKINVGGGQAWLYRVFDLEGEYPAAAEMAEALTEAGAKARIAADDAE